MNLILDIGNTSAKAALYNNNVLVRKERLIITGSSSLGAFLGKAEPEGVIISSVSRAPSEIVAMLPWKINNVHILTWKSRFPFGIDYKTPGTIGVDRLAAAAGAMIHHPGNDILIIDAGSAVTFDIIAGGTYLGGSISPGLGMRFKALHHFTGKLPQVEYTDSFSFPGNSTDDAIAGGVLMGLAFEVNGYLRTLGEKYKNLVTIITGGDAEKIKSKADSEIFLYPDLVTDGLNYLLELNHASEN